MNCLRAELYVRSRDDRVTKLQKIDTLKLRFSKVFCTVSKRCFCWKPPGNFWRLGAPAVLAYGGLHKLAPAVHWCTQSHALRSWAYSSRSRVMPSSPTCTAGGEGAAGGRLVCRVMACCMAALAVRSRSGRGVVHFDLQPTVVHSSGGDWMAWGLGAGGADGAAFMGRFGGVAGGWFGPNPTEHRVRSFSGAETL